MKSSRVSPNSYAAAFARHDHDAVTRRRDIAGGQITSMNGELPGLIAQGMTQGEARQFFINTGLPANVVDEHFARQDHGFAVG